MYRNDNLKKLIKISMGIMHNKTIFKYVRFTYQKLELSPIS